jgi:hypothetical protein
VPANTVRSKKRVAIVATIDGRSLELNFLRLQLVMARDAGVPTETSFRAALQAGYVRLRAVLMTAIAMTVDMVLIA